jgi:hypothetical protein
MIPDLRDMNTNRRKFLRDIAAASGLAVVAGTTTAAVAGPAVKAEVKPSKPAGYRVTAHVSKYYDKARY